MRPDDDQALHLESPQYQRQVSQIEGAVHLFHHAALARDSGALGNDLSASAAFVERGNNNAHRPGIWLLVDSVGPLDSGHTTNWDAGLPRRTKQGKQWRYHGLARHRLTWPDFLKETTLHVDNQQRVSGE